MDPWRCHAWRRSGDEMNTNLNRWRQTSPSQEARTLHGFWRINHPTEIRTARRRVIDIVNARTGDTDKSLAAVSQRLATVFMELASNGLRHGGGQVTAALHLGEAGWLLSVVDGTPERAPGPPSTKPAAGGLGLVMVALLAATAGWDTAADSKRVWAVIDDTVPPQIMSRRRQVAGN